MWLLRSALLLIAFAVATFSSGEAGQKPTADRTAATDHARCIRNGFTPRSPDYDACRRQLATARAEQQDDDPIWWLRKSNDRGCRFWGYEPGTAAFTDCLKRLQQQDEQREKQGKAEEDCLKNGTGMVLSRSGSSFTVSCAGTIIQCPGHFSCPLCPGSIGCPR
jgi:hypothetical protein